MVKDRVFKEDVEKRQLDFKESKAYPKISGVRYFIMRLKKILKKENFKLFLSIVHTSSFIVLTIAAVYVAYYQAQLMKSEHLPILYPQVEKLNSGKECLVIYNKGKPIASLKDCKLIVFLKVVCWNRSGDLNLKIVLIPLLDYYSKPERTENLIGKIIIFKPTKNNYRAVSVVNYQFMEFIKNENKIGYITLARFVRIIYLDMDKEMHDEVYFIDETFGGYKLPDNVGKAIYEYYYKHTILKRDGVCLEDLKPNLIYAKWSRMEEVNFAILQNI